MDYQKTLCYLNGLINYEKFSDYNYANTYSLDRIHNLLLHLGNPHKRYPSIIISGTKGKGSCVCMLSSVLNAAGIRTGKFISPHLVSVRERIEVSGKYISKKEFSSTLLQIKKVITRNRIKSATFFEVLTAAAFLYFARKRVEIAVLEVGLGGRLDATNVAQSSVAGIMPISYDHTHLLGTLLKDIAQEKCGIIHTHSSVVSAPQRSEVLSVIKRAAGRKKANLQVVGKGVISSNTAISLSGTRFDLKSGDNFYKQLYTPLVGRHQAKNAAVAICLLDQIKGKFGFKIEKGHVRKGLADANLPGRFQVLSRNPYIILDGAQNRASAKALRAACNEIFKKKCSCIVLGVSADKDVEAIIRELSPLAERIIFTRADSPRALEPELLAQKAAFLRNRHYLCYDIKDALKFANAFAGRHGIILITGSLFLVRETLEALAEAQSRGLSIKLVS
jgi:dihydrofolate synthase/folylpolyglutamate synthase